MFNIHIKLTAIEYKKIYSDISRLKCLIFDSKHISLWYSRAYLKDKLINEKSNYLNTGF